MPIKDTLAIQFQMISAGAAGGGLWRFVLVVKGLGIGEVGSPRAGEGSCYNGR